MKYSKVIAGTFIDRPNRFIANVRIQGEGNEADSGYAVRCHVKNTGRCREILVPGTKVVLYESDNPSRSTRYDLVAAWKGDRLINIDSQAPNQVVKESFSSICSFDELYPEYTFGESRFDFSAVRDGKRIFAEVKGVTQEHDNHVMFPDAPTERGLKHVRELIRLASEGYECYIVLVIQMSNVDYFIPNYETHLEFGKALEEASDSGVRVLAFDCDVYENGMTSADPSRSVFKV